MIRRMRIKIIAVSMASVIAVLIVIFVSTNIFVHDSALNETDAFLQNIVENEGKIQVDLPKQTGKELPPGQAQIINGVSILLTEDMEITEIVVNDVGMEESEIELFVTEIINDNKNIGTIDDYRYRIEAVDDGYIVAYADTASQNKLLDQLQSASIRIGIGSAFVLFILTIFLSRYITKPVEEVMEKQKRFIADSSHELKTPLSIMSVNLDMLEMEVGTNSRITAMGSGIKRMNNLIHELLLLAKTEQKTKTFKSFNLSEVMESTILPLEVIAYEEGKRIDTDIKDDVILNGDEESIRKMIGALMENAIKYSNKDSMIRTTLKVKGDQKIIEIYNEGIGVTKEQKEKLFDKFYRADDSRDRDTGGHGIGLSIVKNVVDMHKGKILVNSVYGEYIEFKITLQ